MSQEYERQMSADWGHPREEAKFGEHSGWIQCC